MRLKPCSVYISRETLIYPGDSTNRDRLKALAKELDQLIKIVVICVHVFI